MLKKAKSDNSFLNSSVIQFLSVLTKEEMRLFDKFIHSPFHNNRNEVSKFFDEIKKYYPSFSQKEFSKENIYKSLYPKMKYRDDVIRRLSSNLFKAGEEFAAYTNFRGNSFEYEKNLLDFYSNKSRDKFFSKQLEKTQNYLQNQSLRDAEYYYKSSMLNEIERTNGLKDDPTYKRSGFEEQIKHLWKYALGSLLRVYGFANYEIFFFNKKYDLKYLEPLLRLAERSDFMDSITVEIYYLVLKLYSEQKNDEIFYRVKKLVDENLDSFDKHEGSSLYIHLINYCNINALNVDHDYTRVKFELSKKMVEHGLLTAAGSIDPGWFRGVFFMSFNAGEIKFAEDFIENYKHFITGEDRESVINHAYAHLAIYNEDYDKALKYLSTASYRHVNDKMTIKFMYMKIYFATDNYERFFYCADSLKHLIKEEGSLNENLTLPIKNFIKYSDKLFKLKLKEIAVPPGKLKEEIMSSKIVYRKWLVEKAEELENNR